MKSQSFIIWLLLLFLTVLSAIVSNNYINGVFIILILAVLKFIGVSFYFMEIKKAHVFWKALILGFLALFSTTIIVLLN